MYTPDMHACVLTDHNSMKHTSNHLFAQHVRIIKHCFRGVIHNSDDFRLFRAGRQRAPSHVRPVAGETAKSFRPVNGIPGRQWQPGPGGAAAFAPDARDNPEIPSSEVDLECIFVQ